MNITREQVLETMRTVVAEWGDDYLYTPPDLERPNACLYAKMVDGELRPSCIVGHVLYRLNVPLAELALDSYEVGTLVEHLDLDIEESAVNALSRAQEVQDGAVDQRDSEHTWGAALEAAEEEVAW